MNTFRISNLAADCTYGYQVFLYLPEAKIHNRAIVSKLSLYCFIDGKFPQDKIIDLMDGERREGWLNFYFMRFSNNASYIFSFGLNNEIELSEYSYVGDYQAFPDVLTKLIGRLNKSIEDSADELRRLYTIRNVDGIKKTVTHIIHSIR